MNIFPFFLGRSDGERLFCAYILAGGATPSWASVDVVVRSPTRVTFKVYATHDSVSPFATTNHTYPDETTLAKHVRANQLAVAERVLNEREAEAARLARAKALDAIYLELFGDLPGEAP